MVLEKPLSGKDRVDNRGKPRYSRMGHRPGGWESWAHGWRFPGAIAKRCSPRLANCGARDLRPCRSSRI